MRRALLFAVAAWAVGACPAPARAQRWSDSLFPEPSHDFGTVARGSKIKHSFRLVNTTNQDLHIATWRTKCGCTEVRVGSRDVPPGTATWIEATLDTTKFQGFKASGLTLVFDRPTFEEKDLNLTCFIRGDVLLEPGVVDFGTVGTHGQPAQTLHLNYYGGVANWGITEVATITPHVKARVERLGAQANGAVAYQISVSLLPGAPTGYFKDEITLKTNDASSPTIPISVAANVQSAITVSPAPLMLGTIRAGQTISKDVLVRSSSPAGFKVTGVKPLKGDLAARLPGEASRPIHKLTVTIKAPTQPGPYNAVLEIATDLKDEPPAKLSAFATVVP